MWLHWKKLCTQYSTKRALYFFKRALYSIKRALHPNTLLGALSPVSSLQQALHPIFLFCVAVCVDVCVALCVAACVTLRRSKLSHVTESWQTYQWVMCVIFWALSHVTSLQRALYPIFYQMSPIILQKSPIFHQKSLVPNTFWGFLRHVSLLKRALYPILLWSPIHE